MVQTSGNFPSLVDFDPVLTTLYYNHYNRELGNGGVGQLFNMGTSNKSKETDLRVGGFSDPKLFTGTVEYNQAERGYEIEIDFPEYANGFIITRKMRDDLQYDNIFAQASELAVSFARKRRKDMASVFNNSTSASHLGYDSKALCANDHPQSRTDSTAVDNLLANPLNSDTLETAITTMQDFGDDLGEEISIMPNVLIVPRALRKTAYEITVSDKTPENANNASNVHEGMSVIVDPYLTSSTAWWVADSTMALRYNKWYDRIAMEFAGSQDFDTMMWKYRGYNRYGYGWSDFRWLIQGNS